MAIAKDFGFLGRLCLDFAHTGDLGYGRRFERLTSTSELQRWLSLSPLALSQIRVEPADLLTAKRLRRAIWRIVVAIVDDKAPAAADVRVLNRLACQPGLVRALDANASSMHWRRPTLAAALATIAQDAIILFADPAQRKRIRRCRNSRCRVVFYDDSRPGRRLWCAPNRCGDRIRAQRYRERQRSGHETPVATPLRAADERPLNVARATPPR
jgi:predicted RNA-binding Zn ribbon-like protein